MNRLILLPLLLLPIAFAWSQNAQNAPFPADQAAGRMKLPEGFRATLLASEPQLKKPIAMTVDDRGRLWVVESHSYPAWIEEGKTGKVNPEGKDRILILDGNQLSVAWDKGKNLSGIAHGFGGLWLCSTPNLIFLPLKDDKPAGPPRVVLDGWDPKAIHNVFNTLRFGPDGWLYGCNGIGSNSLVGKPGAAKEARTAFNCGVWRYHPIKDRFEVVAWGGTNPWGLDFDLHGELFMTNCVIKHAFHMVPGAHFTRMYGQDLNPYTFRLMESQADHIHWAGGDWTSSRGGKGAHSDTGGGHAHSGCMIYLGDNWPDEYRNRLFMSNIHGNRINQDVLERKGSGYVLKHAPDFLLAHDPWFRALALEYGPDGGVFISDWCDTGECHNYNVVQPMGRVYKVTFGQPKPVQIDLNKLTDMELVELQLHKNDWYVRHARRILQERAAPNSPLSPRGEGPGVRGLNPKAIPRLQEMLAKEPALPHKLRALWALHVTGGLDEKQLLGMLDHAEDAIRVWAIHLLLEDKQASDAVVEKLEGMARKDHSASVRLALASALQRLPVAKRWGIALNLAIRTEDAADPYLPCMIWYGVEPMVAEEPERAALLSVRANIPFVREAVARRTVLAAESSKLAWPGMIFALDSTDDTVPNIQLDVLRGIHQALQGRRNLKMPEGWPEVQRKLTASPRFEVRRQTLVLSVLFGDVQALAALRGIAASGKETTEARENALRTLIELKSPDLLPLLRALLADAATRPAALRGLAAVNDPAVPELILASYARLTEAEKTDAIQTLVSRPAYASVLLDAMEKGGVPRKDVSIFAARQVLNLKDAKLTARLETAWGVIRPTAKDKVALLSKYKALATPANLDKADRAQGRAVFNNICASCHTLFSDGGKIGPDLTGSQRAVPEYILTELLDPSAVVAKDYQLSVIETNDGRIINGIVVADAGQTLVVQTQNERITLAKGDIGERRVLPQSMMPEGILAQLADADIRNLLAYLAGKEQVALPAGK